MNKLLFTIVFLCSALTTLKAQKRVDGADIVKIEKQSQIVSPIVGWCYDDAYNKWCGYYSIIFKDFKNNNKTPKYPSNTLYSFNEEEVFSLQMKSIFYNGENLYLLYIEQQDYYYDYPTIEEGYHSYKKKTVFFIKQEEYEKMWNLQTGINRIRILNSSSFGHFRTGYKNENNMLAHTFKDNNFSLEYKTYDRHKTGRFEPLTWFIKKEEDGTIRFQFPTENGLLEDAKIYNSKLPKNAFFYEKRSEYDAKDFSTEYYEISNANYQKLKIR